MKNLISTAFVAGFAAAPIAAQGSYTTYGQGCSPTAQVPVLSAQGSPAIGEDLLILLNDAGPGPVYPFMTFGLSQANFTVHGCGIYTSQEVVAGPFPFYGTSYAQIHIPNHQAFVGMDFFNQWLLLTPLGLATSNAGHATIGLGPVEILTTTFQTVNVGGPPFQILGRNLGTDPADLCVQVVDWYGATASVLTRNLVQPSPTSPTSATMELMTGLTGIPQGNLRIKRGNGVIASLSPNLPTGQSGEFRAWTGTEEPGNSAIGTVIVQNPSAWPRCTYQAQVVNHQGRGVIAIDVPSNPCGYGQPHYPAGWKVSLVVHWKTDTCSSAADERWWDFGIYDFEITENTDCETLAAKLRNQLEFMLAELATEVPSVDGSEVRFDTIPGPAGSQSCRIIVDMPSCTASPLNVYGFIQIG